MTYAREYFVMMGRAFKDALLDHLPACAAANARPLMLADSCPHLLRRIPIACDLAPPVIVILQPLQQPGVRELNDLDDNKEMLSRGSAGTLTPLSSSLRRASGRT